mgnify:CR=1 FL=1|jgi:Phosphodiesterase/alkaline phosphatase D
MSMNPRCILGTGFLVLMVWMARAGGAAGDVEPMPYPAASAHAPSPLPDRIVLTWAGDPSTTQAVTWRTDMSIRRAVAEIAVANDYGRTFKPKQVMAETTGLKSDLSEALYHTVFFDGLTPDCLYAYRVGDGANWSEWFHFRTASAGAKPFTFIYCGDGQSLLKPHWSRVVREAFRTAPRAAFTLHAGDLINLYSSDAEWGEWHAAAGWINAMVPVIAAPGNHDYYAENAGPKDEMLWTTKDGRAAAVRQTLERDLDDNRVTTGFRIKATSMDSTIAAEIRMNERRQIVGIDAGVTAISGFTAAELMGTKPSDAPLHNRPAVPGTPAVAPHWRPQFAFPIQNAAPGLEETCYYIDYQGARIVVLDSMRDQEAQLPWLRSVLQENPHAWTIVTFHHPMFSPARERDNPEMRALWKPVLDEFKVDLVLTGHDHTYARAGKLLEKRAGDVAGIAPYDPEVGTVYVVSVSGPKMYDITNENFVRTAEDTQLYQIVRVEHDELHFEARTATNRLYDAFTLKKRGAGLPNELHELLPEQNRRR